jgi:uncharacterized membrane protein (GlpM family)
MELLLTKAVIILITVFSLTYIAENISVKISGIIAGLPIASTLILYFFSLEYGIEYMRQTIPFGINGLLGFLGFCISYYIGTFFIGRLQIFICLFLSCFSYLFIMYLSSLFIPNIVITPIVVFSIVLIPILYFSKKEDYILKNRKKQTTKDLIIRVLLTLFIFIIITNLPKFTPASIAGFFSSFPVILLPLLLIIHINYSNLEARTLVKNSFINIPCVIVNSLIIYISYPIFGIYLGTIFALFVTFIFVFLQIRLLSYYKKSGYRNTLSKEQVK